MLVYPPERSLCDQAGLPKLNKSEHSRLLVRPRFSHQKHFDIYQIVELRSWLFGLAWLCPAQFGLAACESGNALFECGEDEIAQVIEEFYLAR